ncbi:hypothetical protein ACEPAI_2418 [Sanghuangporus weigelae]
MQLRDSNSSPVSSRIPLEILLPVSCSVVILCMMTAVLVTCIRHTVGSHSKKLATSPSLLVFSDPEANRQWLNDLASMKDLGLTRLKSATQACSLGLEAKCRGEVKFGDNINLVGIPARPQSAFFLGWRSHSARRVVVRRSWIRSLFHSSRKQSLPETLRSIPEIRITVPSIIGDIPGPSLLQNRRWSRIIARDIGLTSSVPLDLKSLTVRNRSAPIGTKPHCSKYLPSTMDTLPIPAQRQLSSQIDIFSDRGRDACTLSRPLSPITEAGESLSSACSTVTLLSGMNERVSTPGAGTTVIEGSSMSSYGLALLHSSTSAHTNVSSSTGRSIFGNSCQTENPTTEERNDSSTLGRLLLSQDKDSISSIFYLSRVTSELWNSSSTSSSLPALRNAPTADTYGGGEGILSA